MKLIPKEGRWIVVVLRDEYENAQDWIEEFLNIVPKLMHNDDRLIFQAKFEIFPPILYAKAPLGGKMQQGSEGSYEQIMSRKSRYTDSSSKATGKVWKKPARFFVDANPANFPALPSMRRATSTLPLFYRPPLLPLPTRFPSTIQQYPLTKQVTAAITIKSQLPLIVWAHLTVCLPNRTLPIGATTTSNYYY